MKVYDILILSDSWEKLKVDEGVYFTEVNDKEVFVYFTDGGYSRYKKKDIQILKVYDKVEDSKEDDYILTL